MEHPCQQCGTTVEEGRPFCPQCRAPQIHVQVADAVAGPDANPALQGLDSQFAQTGHSNRPVLSANVMDSRIASRAALKAGALGVFIAAIPFIGMMLTGALAVFFYRRKSGFILPAALGARLGGAAGVVVFAVSALFVIAIVVLHAQQECIEMMMTTLQRFGTNTADPVIQANIRNVFTLSGQALSFLVAVVFGSVGGALASFLLRPRNPRL